MSDHAPHTIVAFLNAHAFWMAFYLLPLIGTGLFLASSIIMIRYAISTVRIETNWRTGSRAVLVDRTIPNRTTYDCRLNTKKEAAQRQ